MRRLFKAGERMPHAVLLREPGLWKNLTGSSRRQIQSLWKLVDYLKKPQHHRVLLVRRIVSQASPCHLMWPNVRTRI
jgi:hypothetical protein